MAKKYGRLNRKTWQTDLKQGIQECFRVLKKEGLLLFKWSSKDIKLSDAIDLANQKPLIVSRNSERSSFVVFIKEQA